MAIEAVQTRYSAPASGNLSAHQYKGVSLNGSGELALATSGAACIGILQDNPGAQGVAGNYAFVGVTKILCGEQLATGAKITLNGSGVAVAAGTDDVAIGRMVEGAGSGKIGSAKVVIV